MRKLWRARSDLLRVWIQLYQQVRKSRSQVVNEDLSVGHEQQLGDERWLRRTVSSSCLLFHGCLLTQQKAFISQVSTTCQIGNLSGVAVRRFVNQSPIATSQPENSVKAKGMVKTPA